MAGRVVRVISLEDYDFTDVGANSIEFIVAKAVDVSRYKEGELIARLHDATWPSTKSDKVSFVVEQDGFTEEDPTTKFTGNQLASLSFEEGTDTAPSVQISDLTGQYKLGSMVKVKLVASRPGGGTAAFTCKVSADLVLKE